MDSSKTQTHAVPRVAWSCLGDPGGGGWDPHTGHQTCQVDSRDRTDFGESANPGWVPSLIR